MLINLNFYKINWNNKILPLAMLYHVILSETYSNVLNVNLKLSYKRNCFPKDFSSYLFVIFIQKLKRRSWESARIILSDLYSIISKENK